MAEFQEVMRQFDRMCKALAGCVDCPLAIKGTVETKCNIGSFIDESEYVEQEIMRWAANHPEPVYPRWCDWLAEQGVLVSANSFPNMRYWYTMDMEKMEQPIPVDIAKKLGLKPKES